MLPLVGLTAAWIANKGIVSNRKNTKDTIKSQEKRHQVELRLERYAKYLEIANTLLRLRDLRSRRVAESGFSKTKMRESVAKAVEFAEGATKFAMTSAFPVTPILTPEQEARQKFENEEVELMTTLNHIHAELTLLIPESESVRTLLDKAHHALTSIQFDPTAVRKYVPPWDLVEQLREAITEELTKKSDDQA